MTIETEMMTIIKAAMRSRASDIYWLPARSGYQVSIQAAGHLQPLMTLDTASAERLINHVKYRSNMAISDHRRPQLGAMNVMVGDQRLDLRISTVGDFLDRESLVVRLLYALDNQQFRYLVPGQRDQLRRLLRGSGLILFSGPMGSGKTSTMYDLARELRGKRVVMTIEDPVEVYEPAFLQLQVNPTAQMAYPELLKVGLRHHPDVFIIGEIRDAKTAQIAVQAALSGHLVLSTLHARGVYGIPARLTQLGVAPALLGETLRAAVYQRLVTLTDGQPATLFDIAPVSTDLLTTTDRLMTVKWGQLIDEQLDAKQLTPALAAELKGA